MDEELTKMTKISSSLKPFNKLGQIPGYCPEGQLLSCATAQAYSRRRIQDQKRKRQEDAA